MPKDITSDTSESATLYEGKEDAILEVHRLMRMLLDATKELTQRASIKAMIGLLEGYERSDDFKGLEFYLRVRLKQCPLGIAIEMEELHKAAVHLIGFKK